MNRKKGFTLLELVVVVVILAILVMIAAPNYRSMIANSKAKEFAEAWQTSYYFAQKEALLRKAPVVVCASIDGLNCDTKNFRNFSKGWIVQAKTGNGTNEVLQVVAAPNEATEATFSKNSRGMNSPISKGAKAVKVVLFFQRDGRLPNGFMGNTLTLSAKKKLSDGCPLVEKQLIINTTGRIKLENIKCP